MPWVSTRLIFTSPVLPKEVQAEEHRIHQWGMSGWGGITIIYVYMSLYTAGRVCILI